MPTNDLRMLLRHWRGLRGKSQLDLSIDTGVSQRHLSFIESGRSIPGREVLLKIARTLDIPLRDRNTLLLAAGYAPIYSEGSWNTAMMGTVTDALQRMLRQHEPFPAVVLDRYWNVLMANDYAPRLFGCFIDLSTRPKPRNLLHLIFDPAGLRPFIINWEAVAQSLFERVYRESVGRLVDEKTRELLSGLLAYPDVQTAWKNSEVPSTLPVIPISFVKDEKVLSYFSMVATVGTPQAVVAQELRIECLFPADDITESRHLELVSASRPPTDWKEGIERNTVDSAPKR